MATDATVRMPGEWEPHQAVWMLWPHRPDNWREQARPAQRAFAAVAAAISARTPVFMGVPPAMLAEAQQVMDPRVTLVEMASDDAWMRDTGPTIVVTAGGQRKGIDWQFNAWGGVADGLYDDWAQDDKVAAAVLAHLGIPRLAAPLILEGGSVHCDGEGTLLTTAECLLNPNRNPQLSQEAIESLLSQFLGVTHFIWLPHGVYCDETDGHIDNMCCFARPGEVILHWCDDPADPQYARSRAALAVLEQAVDAKGRRLKVWKMPAPPVQYASSEETAGLSKGNAISRQAGQRLAGSYVNYLVSNQQIIFPLLDAQTDRQAQDLLQQIFPDYLITGVAAREILLGGGNIHCITQQIPRG
ncbi:agmatine deiminase [Erwinia sp. OLTSP20]|uniref:agmatine deiminase n=1 Tax=unclassified Erwinia TaxID=2622719 RepID=UPI000C3A70FB|nr:MULTISPECIES: agmatine deiminase [unclassified Erwinia]PIJ50956.1 agmatine deiminase [Erwinia sp. OAMSP11]PIJ75916.1 agmatine deiminase [Erwinia sp. OLSSP12]PIJ83638.1 agmatine deiminase [Erwinia sp. OLCASP19]PIJ87494.1 agmatine deiminase [Erwinia sp. OLMTSP26]PIJ89042.1 agmatine deiminase [Erwinia sp. OLMDSP33]